MNDRRRRVITTTLGGSLVLVGIALILAGGGPAADAQGTMSNGSCQIHASWLCEVDIGARFFVEYAGGHTRNSGAMSVEWITFDATLFGNFPDAVRASQAVGVWQRTPPDAALFSTGPVDLADPTSSKAVSGGSDTYEYTWIAYGLDAGGVAQYAIRGSGTGTFDGCDTILFDYVMEVFTPDQNPITDVPITCLAGIGEKHRIPVMAATCP